MTTDLDSLIAAHLSGLDQVRRLRKIFVVGCAKSGTTWVMNLLNGHPRAVVSGEGGFAARLAPVMLQAFRAYNDHQQKHGHGHTAISGTDQVLATRLTIDGRFLQYVRASGQRVEDLLAVGDKTPQHTIALELLAQIYPEARFVHIVRDPRDVATSAWFHFGRDDGRSLAEYVRYFMTEVWPLNVASARKSGAQLGERYLELRYEDLLVETAAHVRAVLRHVGLPDADSDLAACIDAGRFEGLSGGRRRGETDPDHFYRSGIAGDWVHHLPADVVARCSATIGPLMSDLGYEATAVAPVS